MTDLSRTRLTADQRRAYIDTMRRTQSLTELERKARKANRRGFRRVYAGVEGVDLSLAKSWRERQAHFANARPPENFCWYCQRFGQMPWIETEKRYSGPIQHTISCGFSPDDGPYPGWHAARPSPKERPDD